MVYDSISENSSTISNYPTEVVTGAASSEAGSVTYQVESMSVEQFQTIVGTTEYMNITVVDCMGLYFVSLVAGFTLASIILVVKKAFTGTKEILTKVIE